MCHLHFYLKVSRSRHCANRIVHIIFKIDQKSLSKLFMTSQQTFTCSKSTRETLEVDVVLMSLFFTITDFKQENAYLDRFFWLWNYIHLHIFFSNNKALLSSTLSSYINVWNNKHWNVSERSNLFWVVLVHDTRSNDARFIHRLCKHAYFISI